MADWAVSLFGDNLLTKEGIKSTKDVLNQKKCVGIYFSAHWCPPCRGFTPILAEFYDQLKDEEGQEDSLEIIFASSDHDENSFEEYYRSQPWVSMPYENQTAIRALGQKYGVRGIPSFIILKGNDGTIIDSDGRGTVIQSRGDTTKVLSKWLN